MSASGAGPTLNAVSLDVDPQACGHTGDLSPVIPSGQGCGPCLAAGDRWVHLRMCMTCGEVRCCDSSPNRHATAHHNETQHPVIRSMEPREDWGWCFPDQLFLQPR